MARLGVLVPVCHGRSSDGGRMIAGCVPYLAGDRYIEDYLRLPEIYTQREGAGAERRPSDTINFCRVFRRLPVWQSC